MAKETQMQHPYELFAYEVGKDMKTLEERMVKLEGKSGQSQPQPQNPTAVVTQNTIETFVFNVKAELSPEDKAKVDAGTHEANNIEQNQIDIVLVLGEQYANKHFILFSDLGKTAVNGVVNSAGNIPMGKLSDMKAHQVLVQVFNNPMVNKVPAYLSVSKKTELLSRADGLEVAVSPVGDWIGYVKLTGVASTGHRTSRYLVFGKDELKIVAEDDYRKGEVIFDSTLPKFETTARKIMNSKPDSLSVGSGLYKFIVKAQEGGTFEMVKQVGFPSQL